MIVGGKLTMNESPGKLERAQALEGGKGIQHLLNEAYKIFGNPLLMYDLDYHEIGYTENRVTDDLLWNEFVANHGYQERGKEFLRDEALIELAANTKTVALISSENMKYHRLYGKVSNVDNIVIGAVDIVACYKPIENDDMPAFEAFCRLLSKEVSKDQYYRAYGEAQVNRLICKLVNGEIEDKRMYPALVQLIYDGLKSNLYLAVVDITQIDPKRTRLSDFKAMLQKAQPEYKYAIYADTILIIIGTDNPALDVEKDLKQINRLFHKKKIYAGISSSFENLFELQKHHQEALSALRFGLEVTSQRIFLYERFR